MATFTTKIEHILAEAVEIGSPGERQAFLQRACGEDIALREEVDRLLHNHFVAGSFLETPHSAIAKMGAGPTLDQPPTERPGTQIGPYKLLQQIGEGGMGVVYMAEQLEPVNRRVALKIIKPGMDRRQVIARFEAERQALSLMDHPNIAKVLDAGATDSGRPYFVMELVKGQPITQYCDDHHLTPRQRLELLLPVCHAIQHAHQKGIIHRDIKPTNILVAEYDNQPVPKVIDFGVAKAISQSLTEKTMFTGLGQIVGTLEYMSPEQAKLNQLDIDTRSDIYSLGVLLYELLTGSTPFDKQRLRSAAFDEMLRIIREEEPPKPSTRLSDSHDSLPSISAQRHTEPAKLTKLVRGELDWIVMKALEKDRSRRYETANGFAQDLQRYLADEPVQACPPSASYRFCKFARRNKTALTTASLMTLAVLLVVGSLGWALRDRTAREEQLAQERTARQARVTGQLEQILNDVARLEQAEKWSEALVSAQRAEPVLAAAEATPDIQTQVQQTLVDLQLVQRLDEIRAQSGTARVFWTSRDPKRNPLALQAEQDYAAAFRQAGIDVDTLSVSEAVHQITARRAIAAALLPALDDWVAVRNMGKDEAATRRLLNVLLGSDPDPWRQQVRDALARKDWPALEILVTSPDFDRQPVATLTTLYAALRANGRWNQHEPVLRKAQWKYPADYWINHRLGVDLIWGRSEDRVLEGMGYLRVAIALRPESSHSVMNLGNGYSALGQHDQAIVCFRKALELKPNASTYENLGFALVRKGQYEEAIAAYEQNIKLTPDSAPVPPTTAYAELAMIFSNCPDARLRNPRRATESAEKAVELEPQVSNHWTALGIAQYRESRWQEAHTALDKSLQLHTDNKRGEFQWAVAINWFFLAMGNWHLGQQDQARQCYDRAVQGIEKGQTWQTDVGQLRRFREEAEELLGIEKEKE